MYYQGWPAALRTPTRGPDVLTDTFWEWGSRGAGKVVLDRTPAEAGRHNTTDIPGNLKGKLYLETVERAFIPHLWIV